MFGSDYPMWDPAHELDEMRASGLTEGELERVLWRNAAAFVGADIA
jgi:predicted TIM-barrel fold metal-dependent hydrolase